MNSTYILIVVLGCINIARICLLLMHSFWYDYRKTLQRPPLTLTSSPKVSVVVTAFNEEKVIQRCLASVYQSTYSKFDLVVANDGSTDQTSQLVIEFRKNLTKQKQRSLRLITTKNGGKARILNYVLKKYIKTPLVMVLDADSIIAPNAIANSVKYFSDISIVAVASNVKIMKQPTLLSLMQYLEYLLGHQLKKAYTTMNNEYIIGGVGSMFRYSILRKVNYFDTDSVTEDIDLSMKILARGNKKHRVVFGSDVICFTEAVTSFKGLLRQRYRWKYGRFQSLLKQKNLLFNAQSKYTKPLTFLQLPFVLFSELQFLFDPLISGLMVLVIIQYQDFQTPLTILIISAILSSTAIIVDDYSTMFEKISLLLLTPLSYVFFSTISMVEYFGLLSCIKNFRGILTSKSQDKCSWIPVTRTG